MYYGKEDLIPRGCKLRSLRMKIKVIVYTRSEKYFKFPRYNMILHGIFRVVSRFSLYFSCYIAENQLPLGQCTSTAVHIKTSRDQIIFLCLKYSCFDGEHGLCTPSVFETFINVVFALAMGKDPPLWCSSMCSASKAHLSSSTCFFCFRLARRYRVKEYKY